jgi:hypothetical protein
MSDPLAEAGVSTGLQFSFRIVTLRCGRFIGLLYLLVAFHQSNAEYLGEAK